MRIVIINFAGEVITGLSVEPTSGLVEVRAALRESIGWRRAYAKLLHGSGSGAVELSLGLTLQDMGVTGGTGLTLVSMPPLRIVVQGHAGVLELYDSDTGARIHSVDTGGNIWSDLEVSPDGRQVLLMRDDVAELWCIATQQRLSTLHVPKEGIFDSTFSPDGQRLLTVSMDKTARLWTVATGECLQTLHGHHDEVTTAVFSPDGCDCLTGADDADARLWVVDTGECTRVLRGHAGRIVSVDFSSDGQQYITGSQDQTAMLWSAATGECTHILRGHDSDILSAGFSPDSQFCVTASLDSTSRIWSVATGECMHVLLDDTDSCGGVCGADFSSDGLLCITKSVNGSALVWSTTTGARSRVLVGCGDEGRVTTLSNDGLYCLTVGIDGIVRLWSITTGECLCALQTKCFAAAFVPETFDLSALSPYQAGTADTAGRVANAPADGDHKCQAGDAGKGADEAKGKSNAGRSWAEVVAATPALKCSTAIDKGRGGSGCGMKGGKAKTGNKGNMGDKGSMGSKGVGRGGGNMDGRAAGGGKDGTKGGGKVAAKMRP